MKDKKPEKDTLPQTGPLAGLKILDFSQMLQGPVAARFMADMGAEVIKVEPLEGDPTRLTGTRKGESIPFLTSNRNKRSIAINLKTEEGRQIAIKLAERADVVIENFRPKAMQRLGLDYENVRKVNPEVIYLSASMYGETGPLANVAGGDPWAQAITGVIENQGSPEGPPCHVGTPFLDYGGALLNVVGILSALYMRQRTGVGQRVANNMVNTGAWFQEINIADLLIDGRLHKKMGRGWRGMFPVGAYPAKDGDVVTIFGQDDDEWVTLCKMLGIEYLLGNPNYDSVQKRAQRKFELYPILDEAFRKKTRKEWQVIFRENRLRCDPCLDYAEFVTHPQFQENNLVIEVNSPREGNLKMIGSPLKFEGVTPRASHTYPPILGEHTKAIMLELGETKERIEELWAQGVIGIATPDMFEPVVRDKTSFDYRPQQRQDVNKGPAK